MCDVLTRRRRDTKNVYPQRKSHVKTVRRWPPVSQAERLLQKPNLLTLLGLLDFRTVRKFLLFKPPNL